MFGRRTEIVKNRPWRISAKLLIFSAMAAVLGFSAVCAVVMLDMRRGEEELARQGLENLASTINSDIGRNIEIYDLSLHAVAMNMLLPEIQTVSKAVRHLILFDHSTTAKHFGAIQVYDVHGKLIIDASTLDPLPEDRSSEEYFQVHRDRPDVGLFISRPMLYRGNYAIVLSRRINDTDGHFMGVTAGSIRFSYFHDLFGSLSLGQEDTITVMRRDGTIIMRQPFDLDVIGKNFSHVPSVRRILNEPAGSYSGMSIIDGISRLFVWRDSSQPMVVLVGKPWTSILNIWKMEATRIGVVVLALVFFVLGGTLFLAREIRRRAEAEDTLEEMATTDGLTGLRNRRKFDTSIDEEWRRATRQKTPVSLLMIDADHFKSFNDTFGHQAGDQVLVGIAICIADSVKRAGDCAARYGGEEFAVLLPGISAADALLVAERIRLKVEIWSDDPRQTTVSIGVASLTPAGAMQYSELVLAADKALYLAKANGRNRSELAVIPKLSMVA